VTETRAYVYTRQSKDAEGDRLAVTRQREACEKLAAARGWTVMVTDPPLEDDDTSASGSRSRPQFEEAMRLVEAGQADVLVVYAADRLCRKLTDFERVIETCERAGCKLATVSGDLDLSTDQGRLVGRILASVARGEVERKSARQKLAAVQRSEIGKPPLGVRLTGYTSDGTVVESEAAIVRQIFGRFHAGASLREIVAWLKRMEVPTRGAAKGCAQAR
jgi:site-specific DNA recombinase